jgi:hypothetical protein
VSAVQVGQQLGDMVLIFQVGDMVRIRTARRVQVPPQRCDENLQVVVELLEQGDRVQEELLGGVGRVADQVPIDMIPPLQVLPWWAVVSVFRPGKEETIVNVVQKDDRLLLLLIAQGRLDPVSWRPVSMVLSDTACFLVVLAR